MPLGPRPVAVLTVLALGALLAGCSPEADARADAVAGQLADLEGVVSVDGDSQAGSSSRMSLFELELESGLEPAAITRVARRATAVARAGDPAEDFALRLRLQGGDDTIRATRGTAIAAADVERWCDLVRSEPGVVLLYVVPGYSDIEVDGVRVD